MLIFTTRSRDEPADSSRWRMLASVWRVSCAMVPGLRSPVAGSVDSMPERKMKSPARMPGLCGRLKLRETLSLSFSGTMTSRLAKELAPSDEGDGVELQLERVHDAHAPHGARRRTCGHVLSVDTVERVVLDAVVDHRAHLHQPCERGAGRLEHELQVLEGAVRFAGERAVEPLAALGIHGDDAGDKDVVAGADRGALYPTEARGHVEAGTRRGHDDPGVHDTLRAHSKGRHRPT